ncbi:hypothetical protein Tsp_07911 [Trichinella spiralis]|uniref:hypothetical protein n=1 Tax=Trichinella spiralis TaxID=6334 RepID=UPI0001EFB483|nr:hypothetical protein Tsp_07911 [Trichinella spiralis]
MLFVAADVWPDSEARRWQMAGRPDGLTIFTAFASAAELEMLRWKGRDFVDLGCQLRLSGPTLEPPDWSIKSKMAPDPWARQRWHGRGGSKSSRLWSFLKSTHPFSTGRDSAPDVQFAQVPNHQSDGIGDPFRHWQAG